MKNNSKFLKNTLVIIGLLVFLYLMTVLNLYKSTKRIDLNIFQSEALPDFLLFCIFVIPVIILFKYLWNPNDDKEEQNKNQT